MQIDPATIFSDRDVSGARRFNRFLSLLPRYRPHRRTNARALNALLRLSQLLPSARHLARDIDIETQEIRCGSTSVPLRRLRPKGRSKGLYLHFHGGAWVLGNARLDDGFNLDILRDCNVEILAVDFHQAVDDRLDRAVAETRAAVEWVSQEAKRQGLRVVIGGESSGAQLASLALLSLSRSERDAFAGFLSFCGAFDMHGSPSLSRADRHSLLIDAVSARANLERLGAGAFCPLDQPLSDLPPALFIAGELDPILDDSRLIYEAWQDRNRNAQLLVVPEAPHGFDRFPTRLAAKARGFAREWLRKRVVGDAT